MFKRKPQLAICEYRALAGVWTTDLQLHDRWTTLSLHLAVPQGSTDFPASGRVSPMDDSDLPCIVDLDENGAYRPAWWAVNRRVLAGVDGDESLCLALQLGTMFLEGRGERVAPSLRCRQFVGTVYDYSDNKCVIGRFSMQLHFPTVTDDEALGNRYRKRIETRPPPPLPRRPTEAEAKRAWLARLDRAPSWQAQRLSRGRVVSSRPPALES